MIGNSVNEHHPFQTLLPSQRPILYRRAMNLTLNAHHAEDLVQDTLLKAWANRDRYTADTQLGAWLFTILRNTFLSGIRKHRREVEDVDGIFAARLSVEPDHDHVMALKEVEFAIGFLPAAQSRMLVLIGVDGYTHLEAASACNCPVGTVKSRLSRARSQLTRMLEPKSSRRWNGTRDASCFNDRLSPGADVIAPARWRGTMAVQAALNRVA